MIHTEPEKDRSERWSVTYSDLMNLLLILFIILYMASKADAAKAAQVAKSIREGFNGGRDVIVSQLMSGPAAASGLGSSDQSPPIQGYWSAEDKEYEQFYNELINLLKSRNLLDRVVVTADDRGIVISLRDNVLFQSGSAELSNDAVSLITSIGNLLSNVEYTQILIEGHTDSDPIVSAPYKDNRDLSSERANNVVRVFLGCGIQSDKIAGIGYGDSKPVAPNDNAADKAKNRRVVITIMRKQLNPDSVVSASSISSAPTTP